MKCEVTYPAPGLVHNGSVCHPVLLYEPCACLGWGNPMIILLMNGFSPVLFTLQTVSGLSPVWMILCLVWDMLTVSIIC